MEMKVYRKGGHQLVRTLKTCRIGGPELVTAGLQAKVFGTNISWV